MSSQLHRICRLSKKTLGLLKPRPSFLIFLFFLVLSGVFWFFMTLNDYYDEEIVIPVRFTDLPNGLIITSDSYDTLHVTVRDKGLALAMYAEGKGKVLTLSFHSFNKQVDKAIMTSSELQKQVQALFSGNTVVVNVKPDRMELPYCMGKPKRVPIYLRGTFSPAINRYVSDTIITPRMATVYGTADVLKNVKYVTTEDVCLRNFTDTVIREVSIRKIEGTRIEPMTIKVKFCSDILMEDVAEVPVVPVNVPEGINMKTFPSRVKVTYTTGASHFKKINTNDFILQVDYNEIREGYTKCPVHIKKKPRYVLRTTPEISQIDFLIEE